MSDQDEIIYAALTQLLEPLAALLLRNGVTHREFMQLSKNAFVTIAERDYGIRGRPTNKSRISAMTGIDRKDVKAIKDRLEANTALKSAAEKPNRMAMVLRAWHEDTKYCESKGEPKLIPLTGEMPSFHELVREYGGGLPTNVLYQGLLQAECLAMTEEGLVRALKPYYSPLTADHEGLIRACQLINELADTLFYNMYTVKEKKRLTPRFERRAINSRIDAKHLLAFREFMNAEGQDFLQRVAKWLDAHEGSNKGTAELARAGVSVFGFEGKIDDA